MPSRRSLPLLLAALIAALWWWSPPPEPIPTATETRAVTAAAQAPPVRPRKATRRPPPVEVSGAAVPTVTCTLPLATLTEGTRWRVQPEGSRVLLFGQEGPPKLKRRAHAARVTAADVAASSLQVPLSVGAGPATVHLDGYVPAEVTLTESACTVAPLRVPAILTGQVRTPPGVGGEQVVVVGCGARTQPDSAGSFLLEARPEPCTLRAYRMDGAFMAWSDPVDLDPTDGAEILIDLDLPSFRASGVGTGLRNTDEGIVVQDVWPDTPAALAGLTPGDLVVGIDDIDVSGWHTDEFIPAALGPPGTPITYHVVRDGAPVSVRMTRQPMDRPEGTPLR